MKKLSLIELLKRYEAELCDKCFTYELSNGKTIRITFYREQFCHLLGIQHVYGKDKHYLGMAGYNKILSEKITVESLKNHNKREYVKIKERISHFSEIPQLLCEGNMIRFYSERVSPRTVIRADFCIYHEKQTYMLHLFLVKEVSTDVYAPTSFVIKFCNDDLYSQFIKNQEYKKIQKRTIEELKK